MQSGNILVVDDEPDIQRIISDALQSDGHHVDTASDAARATELLAAQAYDVAFVDINLPDGSGFDVLDRYLATDGETAIVIITGRATVANAIEATRRGAYDYVTKPFDLDKLRLLARRVLERQSLQSQLRTLRERTRSEFEPGVEIIGQSPAMNEIYKIIGRVASSTATVLIEGESGTGKELIARALHAYSDRWEAPFVAVNCSAIPADLLESEMFGHERGAFTGATDRRKGKFEQAAGGTLLLDEISEMPMPLQAKLLRVLQEREFTRVGGHELIPADCRVIAATNTNVERQVEAGRFRQDLYFRLKVVVIEVPPLRDRRDDIPALVDFFIERLNRTHKFKVRGVSADALSLLVSHAWPGNVRELENVLVRAAAMAPNRLLTADDIPFGRQADERTLHDDMSLEGVIAAKVRDYLDSLGTVDPRDLHPKVLGLVEKPLIEAVLERSGGNQVKAAEMLGINRNTLRKKITELAITLPKGRS